MALLCSGAPFLSSNWPKKKRCFASTFRFDGEATFAGMCPSASGVLASQGLLSTDCWMSSSRASHMRNWKNADLLVMPSRSMWEAGREGWEGWEQGRVRRQKSKWHEYSYRWLYGSDKGTGGCMKCTYILYGYAYAHVGVRGCGWVAQTDNKRRYVHKHGGT